ncbi:RNA polymerase, sigma-24 subunit, ECF subfamily [Candidatus Sulfopaludibacter sp. SbA4]|nr:RNA polymerase, sigma-24 subunit, ECF subfamily [Candidatus Sulfopaludibacter sp. SbA4]
MPEAQPITRLLIEWGEGSEAALDQLTPLVYDELRKLARNYLSRERPGHTLQPTALVHEAYLRLVDQDQRTWQNRAHFFGVAAHLMRLILVDWARKTRAGKRGGGALRVPLEDISEATPARPDEMLALDEALSELEAMDARKAKIIELRYFGGMTAEEVGQSLGVSTTIAERETRLARLWLRRQMNARTTA